ETGPADGGIAQVPGSRVDLIHEGRSRGTEEGWADERKLADVGSPPRGPPSALLTMRSPPQADAPRPPQRRDGAALRRRDRARGRRPVVRPPDGHGPRLHRRLNHTPHVPAARAPRIFPQRSPRVEANVRSARIVRCSEPSPSPRGEALRRRPWLDAMSAWTGTRRRRGSRTR